MSNASSRVIIPAKPAAGRLSRVNFHFSIQQKNLTKTTGRDATKKDTPYLCWDFENFWAQKMSNFGVFSMQRDTVSDFVGLSNLHLCRTLSVRRRLGRVKQLLSYSRILISADMQFGFVESEQQWMSGMSLVFGVFLSFCWENFYFERIFGSCLSECYQMD